MIGNDNLNLVGCYQTLHFPNMAYFQPYRLKGKS